MQTRALKTLVEIANSNSFLLAAKALNMTLSAVSMQMKALEADLGVVLFDRSSRPPQLTPIGRSVCQKAREIMAAESDLYDICSPADRLVGTFRIGFVATASVRLLPQFLIRARRQTPEARFDIETGLSEALEVRVRSGRLDAAVVTATLGSAKDLLYREIRKERLVYVCPADFSELAPDELFLRLPFLHFLPQSGIGKLIAGHISQFHDQPPRRIFLDSVEAIMECVNEGIGFTLLPEPDVLRSARDQTRILEGDWPDMYRDLVLATSLSGLREPSASKIAQLLV